MSEKDRPAETTLETIVEGHVTSDTVSPEDCLLESPLDPCTIVIIGASGDLTSRKLIPSLYNLFTNNGLPDPFLIVGCARSEISTDEFRVKLRRGAEEWGHDMKRWSEFEPRLHYLPISYDTEGSYLELANFLRDLEKDVDTAGNRIFYLSLPMFLYKITAQLLGSAGLSAENEGGNGWSRIVVEKPYGSDRASAADLDRSIHEYFNESQIFRIDHYLAKETVQNIFMFRFANAIFEPIWNRNFIDHVDIIAAETLGVEKRAGYYEKAGVLRDMFQNHMMQLLALTAMEPPNDFESDAVHNEKVKLFGALQPFPTDNVYGNLVLGQYGHGTVGDTKVQSYREEEGVDATSLTPTFAMMRVFVDNMRWQGVPFYLTSGKRLGAKLTEIVIRFRETPHSMFRDILGDDISGNILTMGIQPEEHISLKFQTKSPGAKVCLRTVTMDFNYQQGYDGPTLAAYEKALLDCMNGDQMLFWRQDGIDLTWKFLEPVLAECEGCSDRAERLKTYDAGSWGPVEAAELKKLHNMKS